jgi:hypothetical protein
VAASASACHHDYVDEFLPGSNERPVVLTGGVGAPTRRPAVPTALADTPAARRSNRRKIVLIVVPLIILTGVTLVTVMRAGSNPVPVKPSSVPSGYAPSTDGYFAYAFPATWATNNIYSDNTGDNDLSGPSGWVAEHVGVRETPPVLGEPPPASLEAFGMGRPTPYTLSGGTSVSVPGAVAFRYTMTRPGGFEATVIDAWRSGVGAEMWLVVHADPATTKAIASSLTT